jgi:hypothetical protein
MTGKQVFGPKGFQASKAMAFVYSPDANDFEVIQPWAKRIWDNIESKATEDDLPEDLFDKFIAKLKKHSHLVAFRFLCDGAFAVENILCFDFAYGSYDPDHQDLDDAPKRKTAATKRAKKKSTTTVKRRK